MPSDTARFVGDIPHHYDTGLGPLIFVDYAADVARRVAAHAPLLVLETAAGTGILSRKLRDALPDAAHLTVTDLNPPMLDAARAKFAPGERVAFQPADATALPYPDGGFDAVACQFGVMFYPDKEESYRQVSRVLVPGGRYIFSVWDTHRHNPFGRIAHEVVQSFFPVDPPQFMRVPFSYPFDPIKDSLTAAGFTEIAAAVLAREQDIPDAAAFARGLVHGSPMIEQIRARGGVDPEQVVAAMTLALEREFGTNPGRMPLQAILVSARKPV